MTSGKSLAAIRAKPNSAITLVTSSSPPSSQASRAVNFSSQEYGDINATMALGEVRRLRSAKHFLGSSSRHSKFAMRTTSNGPPSTWLLGRAQASPTENSTRARATSLSSVIGIAALRCEPDTGTVKEMGSGASRTSFAAATKLAEKSTPLTNPKCLVNSNDEPPTAQPRSRALARGPVFPPCSRASSASQSAHRLGNSSAPGKAAPPPRIVCETTCSCCPK
mmetsp:Transcript_4876/g.9164  ORF Transcript_4876/g.9164 Transcript_4876/m.9164 type:complete len:222 (-) Transcript_4876:695-1360(-)